MRRPRGGTALSGAVRLRRDGVTFTGYLTLGSWGWFLYAFGALLPQLGRDQGTSATVTGLHSVMLAVGALIAGAGLVPLVRRFRRRGVIRVAGSLVVVGAVVLAAFGDRTPVTLLAILIGGTGGSLLVSLANPILDGHHGPHGPGHGAAAMAEGNALSSLCALIAPLLVGLGLATGLTWRPAILLTVPLIVLTLVIAARAPAGAPALDAELAPRARNRAAMPAAFWPLFLVMSFLVGVEFVMSFWSAELLRIRGGMSDAASAAGVSSVVAGMMFGRLLTGRFALRLPIRPLLVATILVSFTGFALAWSTTIPGLMMSGLALAGLGMGAHYPLGASLTLAAADGQIDRAAGLLSFGVGVAIGAAPFALGALSDQVGIHTAFLIAPVLMAAALLLLLLPVIFESRARPAVT